MKRKEVKSLNKNEIDVADEIAFIKQLLFLNDEINSQKRKLRDLETELEIIKDIYEVKKTLSKLFLSWNKATATFDTNIEGSLHKIYWEELLDTYSKKRTGRTIRTFILILARNAGENVDEYSSELPEILDENYYLPDLIKPYLQLLNI